MHNNIILIFTKIPHSGYVKTRLTLNTCLTDIDASLIAEAMLKDTLVIASKCRSNRIDLGYTPDEKRLYLEKIITAVRNDGFLSKPIMYHIQVGDNFDERFESVVAASFNIGADNLIVLGSDLPYLDHKIINKAFRFLSSKNKEPKIILGPAIGGGIYLVGLNHSFNHEWFSKYSLFRGGVELSQFIDLCHKKGISLNILPPYGDIDLEEDLISLITYIEALTSSDLYIGFHFPKYTAQVIQNLRLYIGEISGKTRNRKLLKK